MKNIRKIIFLLTILTVIFIGHAVGQVTVAGSTGANGTYTTLKLAFDAINTNGTQAGNNITVTITANTTETATATLNFPSVSLWTSLTIYPTVSGKTISGNINGPLIDFNGAEAVTIDGRLNAAGSTVDLTLSNTSNGTSASTIQLRNDCGEVFGNAVTVKYCNILGSSMNTTGGIILIASDGSGGGNDNNTFDSNKITNAGGNRPINVFYNAATLSAYQNESNKFTNNTVYDFFRNDQVTNYCVYIGNLNTTTITGNSFYETNGAFAATVDGNYYVIFDNNNSGTTITGNYIGGRAVSCGGLAWTKTGFNCSFYAIYKNPGTVTTGSGIQGNTIANINWTNTGAANFYGIYILDGITNIGNTSGNTIGSTTGTGSITFTGGATGATFYGINCNSNSSNPNISNNNIGSITVANGASNATSFFGIYNTTSTGTVTMNNNTIGSTTTANSINASSASSANLQSVYGIYNTSASTLTMSNNTIANLTNGTTNTTVGTYGQTAGIFSSDGTLTITNNTIRDLTIANANNDLNQNSSVLGIAITNTTEKTVSGNTIYNLSNTYASFAGSVIGLYYRGGTGGTSVVHTNFIHSLSVNASSTLASIYGIYIETGATSYYNNIISLGGNTQTSLFGIRETGAASNNNSIYFNSIYIFGTPTAGARNSYALYSTGTANTKNIRNNIFYNARSNSGASGKHYAIRVEAATGLTINNNDYYVTGTGKVLGLFDATDKTTLAAWQTSTGQDVNSLTINPLFANAGGTTSSDYVTSEYTMNGAAGTGITTDFDGGSARAATPLMGAFENRLSVQVYNSVPTLLASYSTLKEAFDKFNDGTHNTGDFTIKIIGNTTETASAVLNANGSGSALFSSINIYPTGTYSITGAIAGALIDLNGADNITIDGRINASGSTVSLIIENTNSGTSACNIKLRADATSNIIKYCKIKSASTGSNSQGSPIYISSASTNGNDNISITYNEFTNSTSRPRSCITSYDAAGILNDGLIIDNNKFYDIIDPSTLGWYGLYISDAPSSTITNNRFYEPTNPIPVTGAEVIYFIRIINNGGHTISGNNIGGRSLIFDGTKMTKTANNNVTYGIFISGNSTVSNIQGNTIKDIAWSNSANADFSTIYISNGNTNIGTTTPNIVGDASTTGSITVTNSTPGGNIYGIYTSATSTVSNNVITSITAANSTGTASTNLFGIYTGAGATISGNTIGSTTVANSLRASSASTSSLQNVYGIYNASGAASVTINGGNTIANLANSTTNVSTSSITAGIYINTGASTISGNTIRDLSNSGGNGNSTSCSVSGIVINANTKDHTISQNTIYNLSNSGSSTNVAGIVYNSSTGTNTIERNFIYRLYSTAAAPTINGIICVAGTATYKNNIISLGYNSSGTSLTNAAYTIYGINDISGTNSIYHNTVFIGGTGVNTGSANSSCIYSTGTNTRDYRNNIFENARSNETGTGKHYAAYLTSNTGLTINYNDYYISGTGGILGNYSSSDQTSLPIVAGQDANSLNINPIFTGTGSTTASDYTPTTSSNLSGANVGVTADYSGTSRYSFTMGAFEISIGVVQVKGTTAGITFVKYPTLKDAFAAINAGTHKGAITIEILDNSTESNTAVLYQSGYSGVSSYTDVTIYPTTNLKISGTISGAPLIEFNGADNVTINGSLDGIGTSSDLTIENLSTSTVAGTSTIKFYNDASNNTLTYCNILGSSTVETNNVIGGSDGGTVFFGTGITTGNDNNTLSFCKIGNSTSGNPDKALYSKGSSFKENENNIINHCEIYNYSTSGITKSYGLFISSNSINWTVSNCSFYQTSSISLSGEHYPILFINDPKVYNNKILGNYIGGSSANCTGTYTITAGGKNSLFCIDLSSGSGGAKSYVTNNTITNINQATQMGWQGSGFGAIKVSTGLVSVTGNNIGSQTATDAIVYSTNNYDAGIGTTGVLGGHGYNSINIIENSNTGAGSIISDNFIGGLTINSTTVNVNGNAGVELHIIYSSLGGGQSFECKNNTIGGNIANSIINNAGSTGTHSRLYGVYVYSGVSDISNNIVRNLTSVSGTGVGSEVAGFYIANSLIPGYVQNVYDNTISNLNHTHVSNTSYVYGIILSGCENSDNLIYRNFIHNLTASSTNSEVDGIKIVKGQNVVYNNIISLASSVNVKNLYGIFEGSGTGSLKLYFNSLIINQSSTNASANSYAFYSSSSNTRNLRNNIFYNNRSGSGNHYAEFLANTTTLTENYNDIFTSNVKFCKLNLTEYVDIATWRTATSQNANSVNVDPTFMNSTGTIPDNYFPTVATVNIGITGTTILQDYFINLRDGSSPTVGAIELVDVYEWTGAVDTRWDLAGNWIKYKRAGGTDNPALAYPQQYDDARIPVVGVARYPYITGFEAACNRLTINAGAAKVEIAPDYSLTINSTFTNNAGNTGVKIYSDATGSGSLIFETTGVSGTVNSYQSGEQWHYISSPVANGTSTVYTGSTEFYKWNAALEWHGTSPTIDYTPWELHSGNLTNTTGYANYTTTSTASHVGTLNQGNFTVNLSKSETGTEANQGWNLIGNPYTSALDWDLVIAEPSFSGAGIEGAIYFFDDDAQNGLQANYRYYVPASPSSGSYGVGTNITSSANDNFIPVGQGFFVKAKLNNMSIFLKNSHRANNTQDYYKSTKQEVTNILRLRITKGEYFDDLVVRFVDGATQNFDGEFDARKLFTANMQIPMLYAMNEDKDQTMAISSNPLFDNNILIPLGIRTSGGEIVINVSEFIFDENIKIFLYDALNNTYTDLSEVQTYTFNITEGYNTERFYLVAEKQIAPQANYTIYNQVVNEDSQFFLDLEDDLFTDINTNDILTYTVDAPYWLSVDNNTFTFLGIPSNENVGISTVTITATDKTGLSASASFDIEVININDAPILVKDFEDVTIFTDETTEINIEISNFTDIDLNDELSYEVIVFENENLPFWINLKNTLTLECSPTENEIGIWNVEVIATDQSGAKVSGFFDINVQSYSTVSNIDNVNNVNAIPNPSSGIFTVIFSNFNKNYSYSVKDINGKIITGSTVSNNIFKLDLSGYSKGTYFITINSDNETTETIKVLVL